MNSNDNKSDIQKMHEEQGHEIIDKLKSKIQATQQNIEVSEELIAGTPSDKERKKLIEKNKGRRHAVGSMEKEIRDTEQELEKRSREA